jgi:hypothetical protein
MAELFERNPKIEAAPMKGECVLFNPQNNKFCMLNATAALLWEQLQSASSTEDLVRALDKSFQDVDSPRASQEVIAVLRELVDLGCVLAVQQ